MHPSMAWSLDVRSNHSEPVRCGVNGYARMGVEIDGTLDLGRPDPVRASRSLRDRAWSIKTLGAG